MTSILSITVGTIGILWFAFVIGLGLAAVIGLPFKKTTKEEPKEPVVEPTVKKTKTKAATPRKKADK